MRKTDSILNAPIGKSRLWNIITGTVILLVAFMVAYSTATVNHDLSFPPIRGGSDQYDYSNMSYTFMNANIIGKYFSEEYKGPFRALLEDKEVHLTMKEKKALDRVLKTDNYERPIPYTYRAWLYPVVIGTTYKLLGYDFRAAKAVNLILFSLSAVMLFVITYRISNNYPSGILASALFTFLPNVRIYNEFMLTEVLAAFMVIAAMFSIRRATDDREDAMRYCLLGLFLGMLVITKHIFLFIIPFAVAPIGVLLVRRYTHKTLQSGFFLLLGILFFVFPWMTWNVGVTGSSELVTGTQGYISIASVYTQEYYEGKSMFPIRRELFKEYIETYDIKTTIKDIDNLKANEDIELALMGKAIFSELIARPEIQKIIPLLIVRKIRWSLIPVNKVLLLFCVVGVLLMSKNAVTWPIVGILVGNLFACGVSFDDRGRLLTSSFPVIVLFGSVGIMGAIRVLEQFIESRKKKK